MLDPTSSVDATGLIGIVIGLGVVFAGRVGRAVVGVWAGKVNA